MKTATAIAAITDESRTRAAPTGASGENMAAEKKDTGAREIRRGLVLPGGAALGAFQAGALKAIRENGIEFHVVAAASIGLIHALAWNRGTEFVLDLDRRWRDDAERFHPFDPKKLLRLKNPFEFRAQLDKLFNTYRSSQPDPSAKAAVPIIVSLTEAATGRNVAFSIADPDLPAAVRTDVCRATTIIPPLGDRPIEIRGVRYYDGGFSNNVPIDFLAELDLDEIWVVSSFPPHARKSWFEPLWRAANAVRDRTTNGWVAGAASVAAQYFNPREKPVYGKSLLIIEPTVRNPLQLLSLVGALTFSPKYIDRLLKLGYRQGARVCEEYVAATAEKTGAARLAQTA
jgi:predicted acylesterase/phospholipase RssA